MSSILTSENVLANPSKLPLNRLYVTVGSQQIKAIDESWVKRCTYPSYAPIIKDSNTKENEQIWLKRALNYKQAIVHLLSLPSHKFWSHIMYDETALAMVESFLQGAEACYDPQPEGQVLELYSDIYSVVFSIYQRMLTLCMSETEHVEASVLQDVARRKGLLTALTLLELARVYGNEDDGTLAEMIRTGECALDPNAMKQLVWHTTELLEATCSALNAAARAARLLYDTCYSLHAFVRISETFREACLLEGLAAQLAHVYEHEVHALVTAATDYGTEIDVDRLQEARAEILELVGQLLSWCMDRALHAAEQPNSSAVDTWANRYTNLVTSLLDQPGFARDCDTVFQLRQQLDTLALVCPHAETTEKQELVEAFERLQLQEEQKKQENREWSGSESSADELENHEQNLDEVVLESKISEVCDMFPHLGDGFVLECLRHLDMEPQRVIMCILEETLPTSLASLDRSMPRIPPESVAEASTSSAGAVVHEHIGKRPDEHEDLSDMLDDKRHVREVRDQLLQYCYVQDDMYNDDVDEDADYMPPVYDSFCGPDELSNKSESETEEPEDTTPANRQSQKGAFCEDPAVIRARREEQRAASRSTTSKGNVVGRPKGQGQEATVQRSRQTKGVHKSSKANHNRRDGARWKRSRAMVPS